MASQLSEGNKQRDAHANQGNVVQSARPRQQASKAMPKELCDGRQLWSTALTLQRCLTHVGCACSCHTITHERCWWGRPCSQGLPAVCISCNACSALRICLGRWPGIPGTGSKVSVAGVKMYASRNSRNPLSSFALLSSLSPRP